MYNKLDKDLKKKAKERFLKSDLAIANKTRFIRIYICIVLLLIYSVYLLIFNDNTWWEYYLAAISIISSILIFIFVYKIRIKLINEFLNSDKKHKLK